MGIGNAWSIAKIASSSRLRVHLATPRRILLQRDSLRLVFSVAAQRLAAFSSSNVPDTFTSQLGDGKSRVRSTEEQAAFEQLFVRYHHALLDFLYGMVHDREIAEDLVQETFLRAYAAHTTLLHVTHAQAWLYRIATNVALNTNRRQRRFSWLPLHHVEPEAGANAASSWSKPFPQAMRQRDFVISIAERDAVWSVLAELPPRWRAVLLLQTTAGFGVREIGTMLQLQEGNVRKILFRAKERFRALYIAQGTGEAEGGQP